MADSNVKKAQKIVNEVDKELGITLVAYEREELEFLNGRIQALLDLEVDMDELHDSDDDDLLDDLDDIEFEDEDEC